MSDQQQYWKKCSSCGKEIGFRQVYQACSVSSCRKWAYCSVDCWDLHNPVMNHKSSWAEENIAPSKTAEGEQKPRRRIVTSSTKSGTVSSASGDVPREVLVVASKFKAFVKAKFDLNTSVDVLERMSEIMRIVCEDAAAQARTEGRKTLMARDFK
jgi:hypothetical protein